MDSVPHIRKNLLPHISRIFSAWTVPSSFRFVLLASFFAFLALNIWLQSITIDTFSLERTNVLSTPFLSATHIALGKALYAKGDIQTATHELLLAEQLSTLQYLFVTPQAVLGAQSESTDLLSLWEQHRTYQDRAYHYWKATIEQTPDYRDGYMTLASISSALGKKDEAVAYLHQAYALDPNNEAIRALALRLGVTL